MRRAISALVTVSTFALAACGDQPSAPTLAPVSSPSAVRQSSGSTTTINVTSTIYDTDALGNLLLTRSDHANGTGFATYTAINGVNSHIASDGNGWNLYLGNQSARTVYLVLGSQGMPVPDGYFWKNTEVGSRCFDATNTVVNIRLMTVGASNGNCMFITDFYSGTISAGAKYKLAMGPNWPGTGRALVTCTAAASGYCTSWTIVPNTSVANAGVANLYHGDKNGSLVLDGVYRDSYSVAVAQ